VRPVEVKIKEPVSGNSGTQQEVPGSGTSKPVQTLDKEPGVVPIGIPMHFKDIDLTVNEVHKLIQCTSRTFQELPSLFMIW